MLLIYRNKGILIVPYLIASLIGAAVGIGVLRRNVGGIFSNIDFYSTIGIGFLLCAIWTYLTGNDYYKDRNGQKQKMDLPNEFFFLTMQVWAYIFLAIALLFFGNTIFGYFGPVEF